VPYSLQTCMKKLHRTRIARIVDRHFACDGSCDGERDRPVTEALLHFKCHFLALEGKGLFSYKIRSSK